MEFVKDFDNFINEGITDRVKNSMVFNLQPNMFSQRTGKWIDLKTINDKYLKEFIERMKEKKFNFVKQYELQGVKYVEFDKPIDWKILNDVYRKIENDWYKETSKM